MGKQLFGTDGIRGVAGEPPLDDRTVYAIGRALADRLGGDGGRVLVAMDTRESGPHLAGLLAAGLAEGGLAAHFAGVLPTAGVSYLAAEGDYRAGVMISASHNPFDDNGIKVFAHSGFKLPDAVEAEVEDRIFQLLAGDLEPKSLDLDPDVSLEERYLKRLLAVGVAPAELPKRRAVVDCANGAAHRVGPRLLAELGVEAEVIGASPNGRNINLDCGSLHLDKLQEQVREAGAELGIAFDGDADRALFVADDGEIVDGDVILLLGGQYLRDQGKLCGGRVVTTVMANMGLEKALEESGLSMARTKVGDKYVLEEMVASGAALGGEQSGHVILREWANTGDGLLTARLMIEILAAAGRPLSELRRQLVVFPQKLVNVRTRSKPAIEEVPPLAAAVAKAERELNGSGRVVVRYSGTEPLARIMVEAQHQADVDRCCAELESVFQTEIGA